jgi:hypothetical protein
MGWFSSKKKVEAEELEEETEDTAEYAKYPILSMLVDDDDNVHFSIEWPDFEDFNTDGFSHLLASLIHADVRFREPLREAIKAKFITGKDKKNTADILKTTNTYLEEFKKIEEVDEPIMLPSQVNSRNFGRMDDEDEE